MVNRSVAFIKRIGLIVFFNLLTAAVHSEMATQNEMPVSDSVKNILFIGNSLTYTNDLPELVTREGRKNGMVIKTSMVAFPNYGLEDHWNDGHIQFLIRSGTYDYVVVQQGPSSQIEGRTMLLDYGARIKALCDSNNTKLAFFMVWPAFSNFYNFDGVIKSYTDAAALTNSLLCPVGRVWKKHFSETNNYSFYGNDKFHPSKAGSKSAARIIFNTLFKR